MGTKFLPVTRKRFIEELNQRNTKEVAHCGHLSYLTKYRSLLKKRHFYNYESCYMFIGKQSRIDILVKDLEKY